MKSEQNRGLFSNKEREILRGGPKAVDLSDPAYSTPEAIAERRVAKMVSLLRELADIDGIAEESDYRSASEQLDQFTCTQLDDVMERIRDARDIWNA